MKDLDLSTFFNQILTILSKSRILKIALSLLFVSQDLQKTERNCLHQEALYLKQEMKLFPKDGWLTNWLLANCAIKNRKWKYVLPTVIYRFIFVQFASGLQLGRRHVLRFLTRPLS